MALNIPTAEQNGKATHEESTRKQIVHAIIYFIAAIPSVFLIVWTSIDSGGIISALIDYSLILPTAALGIFFCCTILGVLSVTQLKRNLHENNNPQKTIKYRSAWKVCLLIITVACILAINIRIIAYSRGAEVIPLSQYSGKFNFPLLEQISPEEWASASKDDMNSFIMMPSRYVAPKILYFRQHSYSEEIRFGYNVDYYEMRTIDLAVRYEDELLNNRSSGDLTSIYVSGFESTTYYVDEGLENMILRSGNIVIHVVYYGSGCLLDSVHQFSH